MIQGGWPGYPRDWLLTPCASALACRSSPPSPDPRPDRPHISTFFFLQEHTLLNTRAQVCCHHQPALIDHTLGKMGGPGVGFEYPPQEVSWLKRDVLLFANSIGVNANELHLLYVCF